MTRAFNGQAKLKRRAVCNDPGARRRGRLARARRLPAEDDERLPDRGRGRRGDDVRRRHQGDVDRPRRGRRLARRPQPHRARPRPRRPPRRGAGAAGADALPPRRAHRRRGRRRRPLLRLVAASARPRAGRCRGCCRCGTAGRSRSPAPSRRATTSRASASSTSPATRPGQIALFRESDRVALTDGLLLHARHRHRPPRRAARADRRAPTSTPSRRAPRSARSRRSSRRSPGPATPTP